MIATASFRRLLEKDISHPIRPRLNNSRKTTDTKRIDKTCEHALQQHTDTFCFALFSTFVFEVCSNPADRLTTLSRISNLQAKPTIGWLLL